MDVDVVRLWRSDADASGLEPRQQEGHGYGESELGKGEKVVQRKKWGKHLAVGGMLVVAALIVATTTDEFAGVSNNKTHVQAVVSPQPTDAQQKGKDEVPSSYVGVVVAPLEQGDHYTIKLASPVVLSGDEDCGQEQKEEIELWDDPSKLRPYVGKTVAVSGQLGCPRGGYVLSGVVFGDTSQPKAKVQPAYLGYWQCVGTEGDVVRSLYFGEDGRYGVYAKTKAGDEGYFAGQWSLVSGNVRTTVQARKMIAFSPMNTAMSSARNQWLRAGGGWNEQRIDAVSPDRIRISGIGWQDERGQSGPLSTQQQCERMSSNIYSIQFP